MFEAVIRMVAGLLAGYYATGERFMLDGARDLADRLLVCFTKSPTGAPYRFANLRTGAVSDPKSNLAEIGSNILEFGDLSRLTGDPKYLNASMRAYETVIAKRSQSICSVRISTWRAGRVHRSDRRRARRAG